MDQNLLLWVVYAASLLVIFRGFYTRQTKKKISKKNPYATQEYYVELLVLAKYVLLVCFLSSSFSL